jgi:putative oxidoreductase
MQNHQQTEIAIALLRLGMGIMFLAHGLVKVLVSTLPGTVGFFESLGLPAFMAYGVTFAEIIGGVLLIIGFKTRLVSWALTPVLLGATWAHLGNGWLFSNANGGWEYPAFLVLAGIVLALSGPGALALDSRK